MNERIQFQIGCTLGNAFRSAFTKADKQLSQLGDTVKRLNHTSDQIKNFQKLEITTKEIGAAWEGAKTKLESLESEISQSTTVTKRQERALEAAKRAVDKQKSAYDASKSKLVLLSAELRAAKIHTGNLAAGQKQLGQALAKTNRQYDRQKKYINIRDRNKARRSEAMGSIVGLGVSAVGVGATLMPALSFEDKMANVRAVGNIEKDSDDDKKLQKLARDQAKASMFNASEVGDAMGYLAMAGFNTNKILGATPGLLELAAAGGSDLAETADIASNILSGFGIEASKMNSVGDVLAATFTSSNTSLYDLGETMNYVAPVANRLIKKDALETVAAMAGLLGDVGIQGSMSGTALRSAFQRLSGPPTEAQKALEKLNIETKDSLKNLRPMPDILSDIYRATKNKGSAEQAELINDIFGAEASSAMTELINQAGSGNLNLEIAKLTMAPAFRRLEADLNKQMQAKTLKTNAKAAGIDINSESALGALDEISAALKGLSSSDAQTKLSQVFQTEDPKVLKSYIELFKARQKFGKSTDGESFFKMLSKVNSAADIAAKRSNTTNGAIKRLGSAVSEAGIAIGSLFLPTLANAAGSLADMINHVSPLAEKYPTLTTAIGYTAIGFVGLKAATIGYTLVATTVSSVLNIGRRALILFTSAQNSALIGTKTLTVATKIYNAVMKANPIGIIITAAVALSALALTLVEDWTPVKNLFSDIASFFTGEKKSKVEATVKESHEVKEIGDTIKKSAPVIDLAEERSKRLEIPTADIESLKLPKIESFNSSDQISVTVNVTAAPGQSTIDIAEEVRRQIEKALSERSSQSSPLFDTGS